MDLRNFLRNFIAACALAASAQANSSAILQINSNGILVGAKNVDVNGTIYDVMLKQGTCSSLFNGCVSSAFAFATSTDALAAAQALLDQVFVDGPLGNFDSLPSKTIGCDNFSVCETLVPFSFLGNVIYARVLNFENPLLDQTDLLNIAGDVLPDAPGLNFAVFSPAAPEDPTRVPEPSSIALMALAMAGLALTRRRKA